jgi:predicted secreted protein
MNKHLKATSLFLSLVGAGDALAEVDSWDAEELGRTYALTELCIDAMRDKHDWKLNRDLKDLLAATETEVEESQKYLKKIDRGHDDATSDFRKLSKDEEKETCYNLIHQ